MSLKLEDEDDLHIFSGLREIKCKEKQSLCFWIAILDPKLKNNRKITKLKSLQAQKGKVL